MKALYIRFVLFLIGPAIRHERETRAERHRVALLERKSNSDTTVAGISSIHGRIVLMRNGQVRLRAAAEESD